MHRSILAALVLAAVVLAGCGGSSSEQQNTPEPSKTSSEPAPTTRSSKQSTAEDRQVASGSLLRLSDLPSGWTASDESNSSNEARCDEIKNAKAQTSARSNSPDFEKGDDLQVAHTVYVYPDESAAQRNFVALSSQALRVCVGRYLGHELRKQIGGDATVGEARTSQLNIDPVGEDSAASRFVVPISTKGIDLNLNVDFVVVRQARAISLMLLLGGYDAFDDGLRTQLVGTAATRLKTAVAS
jgi:hypothetical protein